MEISMTFEQCLTLLKGQGYTNLWSGMIFPSIQDAGFVEVISMGDKPEVASFQHRFKECREDRWEVEGQKLILNLPAQWSGYGDKQLTEPKRYVIFTAA